MPSTLGFALLGLLARQPRTGYELTQALRVPVGYFWTASHSQVYPELARLEAQRLARARVEPGPGPRDTKRYSITAAGRRELAHWSVTPAEPETPRSEELLKIYSLWLAEPARARALVEAQRERHHDMLLRYEQVADQLEREQPDGQSAPLFFGYALLRNGLSYERHMVAWYDWVLAQIATT